MKYLIVFLISLPALAETYVVSHRGHIYTFVENEKALSVKSKHVDFEIPVKPCSKSLTVQIKEGFEKNLRFTTKATMNVVMVTSKKSVNIPEGHTSGKYLSFFPDHFAKSYLVYKELCK